MVFHVKKALIKAVEKHIDRFFGYEDAVLAFRDPEDVHQMRVSGRRLLLYLSMLEDKKESKSARFKDVRKPLKKAVSMLGDLRDEEVLTEKVEKMLPSLTPLQRNVVSPWLESRRASLPILKGKISEELPKLVDKKWRDRAYSWAMKRVPALTSKAAMREKIESLRHTNALGVADVMGYGPPDMGDEDYLTSLHKGVRIPAKKLRYSLAIAKKFIDVEPREIEALKTLQDQLGDIQDRRVWINKLQDFYKDSSDAETRRIVASVVDAWRDEMSVIFAKTDLIDHVGRIYARPVRRGKSGIVLEENILL